MVCAPEHVHEEFTKMNRILSDQKSLLRAAEIDHEDDIDCEQHPTCAPENDHEDGTEYELHSRAWQRLLSALDINKKSNLDNTKGAKNTWYAHPNMTMRTKPTLKCAAKRGDHSCAHLKLADRKN